MDTTPINEAEMTQGEFINPDINPTMLPYAIEHSQRHWHHVRHSILSSLQSLSHSVVGDEAASILQKFNFRVSECTEGRKPSTYRPVPYKPQPKPGDCQECGADKRSSNIIDGLCQDCRSDKDVAERLIDQYQRTGLVVVQEEQPNRVVAAIQQGATNLVSGIRSTAKALMTPSNQPSHAVQMVKDVVSGPSSVRSALGATLQRASSAAQGSTPAASTPATRKMEARRVPGNCISCNADQHTTYIDGETGFCQDCLSDILVDQHGNGHEPGQDDRCPKCQDHLARGTTSLFGRSGPGSGFSRFPESKTPPGVNPRSGQGPNPGDPKKSAKNPLNPKGESMDDDVDILLDQYRGTYPTYLKGQ